MAYPPAPQYPQSPPPGPKTRPGSVTAVVWTQILTAVMLVASGIAMFSVMSSVEDTVTEQLLNDPELADSGLTADNVSQLMTVTFALIAGVYVVMAIFYVILALLVNKGKRPARILSWILSGISLLCCGIGGLVGQLGSMTTSVNGQEYQDEATQAVEEATPGWVTAIDWITLILLIVGSLVIIIMLAVPASNEFFRKEEAPMGPYMGQPPYGQQPPGPGQPPYGQQPPGPGQPPYGQQPPQPGPGQPPGPPQQ
jgi:MFS family permease